ncbi:MAG: hypothetical protein K6G84_10665 [Lachnospiraceae bacterium]|nr:hypothetical protein [Lachnospiraceae bacterium]
MDIKAAGLRLFNDYNGLKSTRDRLDRQSKRDNKIAFYEHQKEKLKNMKTDSLEDISRKLEFLQRYDDAIVAAKDEYNHSQMFHVMDEAMERAEKIAEEAEKNAPKSPEERREEIIEEITSVDKNEGILSEVMDELSEITERMSEEIVENAEEITEGLSTPETMVQADKADVKIDDEDKAAKESEGVSDKIGNKQDITTDKGTSDVVGTSVDIKL